jgi:hypothetical protein
LADWGRGGAGLSFKSATDALKSTAVSTKGDFGVRDVTDSFRICQTDWSQGCGQKTYDRDADSESAFDASKNIDVGTIGEFKLGPLLTTTALSTLYPAVIAHGTKSTPVAGEPAAWSTLTGAPVIWASFVDDVTYVNRIRWTIDGVTWMPLTTTGPGGVGQAGEHPRSFASDGETLYAALASTGAVWRVGTNQATLFGATDITNLAHASGTLYGAKGSDTVDAQLGVFSAAGAWSALSPEVTTAINAAGTTFGLVASGNYVYWGVSNGMVTKVYKALYGGGTGADTLQAVATFPTGFVGASMYAYLGTVYVGGHFDGETIDTGIGSIYAIVGDSAARLTDVGEDRTRDNRVLAISAYERSLYFVSDSQMWRWDLASGGYSHFAGPLNSTPVMVYDSISWTGTWDMDAEPGTGAEPDLESDSPSSGGTTSAAYSSGNVSITLGKAAAAWRRYAADANSAPGATNLISDATGTTMEIVVPQYALTGTQYTSEAGIYGGINGSAKAAFVILKAPTAPGGDYTLSLYDGNNRSDGVLLDSATVSNASGGTIRLTLWTYLSVMHIAVVYWNGVQVCNGFASIASSPAKMVWFGAYKTAVTSADVIARVSRVRWTDDGAFNSSIIGSTAVEGVGLACWRDKVLAACSGYGASYSSPLSHPVYSASLENPYLLSSLSSGNMPTVEKYFSAIHVSHELLDDYNTETGARGACDVACSVFVDGAKKPLTLDASLSSGRLSVFPIAESGRTIRWQLEPTTTTATLTPRITDVAVLFTPTPKVPRLYTYFIRCWRDAEDNTGHDWDEDAPTVSDWLEEIAGTVVTVGRAGRADYNARIEQLELLEAPPSGKANGREGLFQLQVKVV